MRSAIAQQAIKAVDVVAQAGAAEMAHFAASQIRLFSTTSALAGACRGQVFVASRNVQRGPSAQIAIFTFAMRRCISPRSRGVQWAQVAQVVIHCASP
jgi:hypothetical protein